MRPDLTLTTWSKKDDSNKCSIKGHTYTIVLFESDTVWVNSALLLYAKDVKEAMLD